MKVTSDYGTNTLVKSGYIHVGDVGMNDQTKATVMIYPNPVTDVVNVSASSNIRVVQIYNLLGQVVLSQTADSKKISINTTDLKSGVYDLKVILSDGSLDKKIIVQ